MDLWIRNQDRETLTKTEVLAIEDNMIIDYYQKRNVLGIYKTKERALEVLDEIQKILEQPQKHIEGEYTYYMPNDGSSKIYEMPKE